MLYLVLKLFIRQSFSKRIGKDKLIPYLSYFLISAGDIEAIVAKEAKSLNGFH